MNSSRKHHKKSVFTLSILFTLLLAPLAMLQSSSSVSAQDGAVIDPNCDPTTVEEGGRELDETLGEWATAAPLNISEGDQQLYVFVRKFVLQVDDGEHPQEKISTCQPGTMLFRVEGGIFELTIDAGTALLHFGPGCDQEQGCVLESSPDAVRIIPGDAVQFENTTFTLIASEGVEFATPSGSTGGLRALPAATHKGVAHGTGGGATSQDGLSSTAACDGGHCH
jgi:hypothetical protein